MLLLKNKNPLFCLSIMILSIEIVSSLVDLKCNRLSNGCELKSYYCVDNINGSTCHFYVCDKIDANFNFTPTEMSQIRNCSSSHPEVQEALNNVYYRLSKPSVFSGSFDLLNNDLFLTSLKITSDLESDVNNGYEGMVGIKNKLLFRYIKGFDTGQFKQKKIPIRIDFYYSKLDFYLNGSVIRSCEDVEKLEIIPQYIFNAFWQFDNPNNEVLYDIRFYNCEYKTPICPLTILFMELPLVRFFGLQNTYYKSNYPRFLPFPNSSLNLTNYFHKPGELDLVNMQNIELNSKILNRFIFDKIKVLRLFGDIVSIEKGLFKPFRRLNWIHLDLLSTRKLMHRGIDWMLDFNSDIRLDRTNMSLVDCSFEYKCVKLFIYSYYEQGVISSAVYNTYHYFPDEDFCLYAKLPYQQLVLLLFNFVSYSKQEYSCTFLLIIEYSVLIKDMCLCDVNLPFIDMIGFQLSTAGDRVKQCKFDQRFVLLSNYS